MKLDPLATTEEEFRGVIQAIAANDFDLNEIVGLFLFCVKASAVGNPQANLISLALLEWWYEVVT